MYCRDVSLQQTCGMRSLCVRISTAIGKAYLCDVAHLSPLELGCTVRGGSVAFRCWGEQRRRHVVESSLTGGGMDILGQRGTDDDDVYT